MCSIERLWWSEEGGGSRTSPPMGIILHPGGNSAPKLVGVCTVLAESSLWGLRWRAPCRVDMADRETDKGVQKLDQCLAHCKL
ncbi:hypothetical protein FKM82_010126 [Ascaphus truei]